MSSYYQYGPYNPQALNDRGAGHWEFTSDWPRTYSYIPSYDNLQGVHPPAPVYQSGQAQQPTMYYYTQNVSLATGPVWPLFALSLLTNHPQLRPEPHSQQLTMQMVTTTPFHSHQHKLHQVTTASLSPTPPLPAGHLFLTTRGTMQPTPPPQQLQQPQPPVRLRRGLAPLKPRSMLRTP